MALTSQMNQAYSNPHIVQGVWLVVKGKMPLCKKITNQRAGFFEWTNGNGRLGINAGGSDI